MAVLGINRRNRFIVAHNDRDAIALANDKLAAKEVLREAGIDVPETLMVFEHLSDVATKSMDDLPLEFVIKPNRGRQGLGIAVAQFVDDDDRRWKVGGERWGLKQVRRHLREILIGEFSLTGTHRDEAFLEELVVPHGAFLALGSQGLPDIRIICVGDKPIQAMVRLPLEQSEGKANLHQGAVGLAIDVEDGHCFRAFHQGRTIDRNPDTNEPLLGFQVPFWDRALDIARKCGPAIGLGYIGVDLVVDTLDGVQVMEVNAFPGLEIQNVNNRGLRDLIEPELAKIEVSHSSGTIAA